MLTYLCYFKHQQTSQFFGSHRSLNIQYVNFYLILLNNLVHRMREPREDTVAVGRMGVPTGNLDFHQSQGNKRFFEKKNL